MPTQTSLFRTRFLGSHVNQLLNSRLHPTRFVSTASETRSNRSSGSIGDAFASLSNSQSELPERFAKLKRDIIGVYGEAIVDSWMRLLRHLETESIPLVKELSSNSVPEVNFEAIVQNNGYLPAEARELLRERGTIIVRGLVSEQQALDWKQSVRDYVSANPSTKGFPANDMQVYELYWSKAQLEARAHKNMVLAQTALNRVWDKELHDQVVLSEQVAYCDRLRMRTVSQTNLQFEKPKLIH